MPANLHGLNIVHPTLSADRGDAHDLLSGPPFSDLSSQLDLWTTLSFDNEDTPVSPPRDDVTDQKHEEEEEERRPAAHDSHVNVVTGTVIPNHTPSQFQPSSPLPQPQPGFDLNAFLASFGINAYSQPPSLPSQPQPQQQPAHNIPSLAQLLALHSGQQPTVPFNTPISTAPNTSTPAPSETSTPAPPPTKRARAQKSSAPPAESSEDSAKSPHDSGVSAAEDKRRRNTAASARFRLKKKEREAALESRAKELETKVNELERECEGLRRENGWLKGLVVGVTGAQQQQQVSSGQKRTREDDS